MFWFLILHFYTFVTFLVYMSFRLFVAARLDEVASGGVAVDSDMSQQYRERLDDHVTAVHVLHRSAVKRKLLFDDSVAAADGDTDRRLYGVGVVDPERVQALGFKRRLLAYERLSQIYVPSNSPDTRRCDLWNERQDVEYLVKCRVSDGEQACFNCVESRQYVRHCVHFARSIRLALSTSSRNDDDDDDDDDNYIDVPANEQPDEGYCLSSVFANSMLERNSLSYRPSDETRNCNPNTGDWLLARLSASGDTSYNWLCRCRYPNLMTNDTTVFTDCMRAVGCRPHGELDAESRAGRVNPYTSGVCVCEFGYVAVRDPTIGPTCVSRVVITEEDLPQDVYGRANVNMSAALSWPTDSRYLDSRLATVLGNSARELKFPNPCMYDAQTSRLINEADACRLVSERIDNDIVAYCITNSYNAIPVRSDRDYLRNNNGRYANACLLIAHSTVTSNGQNAILSYQNSLDGVNGRPDFGLLFEKSSQLDRIVSSVSLDSRWLAFQRNVVPPTVVDQRFNDPAIRLFHGDTSKWFSAYEQTPLRSRLIRGLLNRTVNDVWSNPKFDGGIVYNLRNREYYWYKVRNPLGNVHWNNGLRSEIANNIIYSYFLYPNTDTIYPRVTIAHEGFAYKKFTERSPDYVVEGDSASRPCNRDYPTVYPCAEFVFPFASGADIDDEQFSQQYYQALCPIYEAKSDAPDSVPRLPFVYNTRFDLVDSTLTLHLFRDRELYIAAERLCGDYRNHRTLMRGRLQGDYV